MIVSHSDEPDERRHVMPRWPSRTSTRISLGLLAAAVPASVALAVWPDGDTSRHDSNDATPARSEAAPQRAATGSVADEVRALEARTAPSTSPAGSPPAESAEPAEPAQPAPPAEPAAPPPSAEQAPAAPDAAQAESGTGLTREEMVISRVMEPVPRPPKEKNITDDIQEQLDEAENGPPIDLGVLEPDYGTPQP